MHINLCAQITLKILKMTKDHVKLIQTTLIVGELSLRPSHLCFIIVCFIYPDPTMMLLIGMNINLTKKPTNPITTNPIAVLKATLLNSLRSGL